MAKEVNQITVFVSCPDDVRPEKQVVRNVCDMLTNALNKKMGVLIRPLDWRKDIIPLITGKGAQDVINSQTEDYDIYVGILWKRFGDVGPSGLTPTEEEFEIALQRMRNNGSPVITFYFKQDKPTIANSYEETQYNAVHTFKQRIRSLGLYDEFNWLNDFEGQNEFQTKVTQSILFIIQHFNLLTVGNIKIPQITCNAVPDYIARKVCLTKDYDAGSRLFIRNELAHSLVNVILQQKRIVLLSDAGVGKTIELQQVAWYFSTGEKHLYPLLVSLNKYVQSLSDLLPHNWSEIPESQLLLVLDGLDEIESQNKRAAIRQIETFSDQHPDARIIVSCRTNFYNLETEQISGTLSKFSSYILLNLNAEDIQNYIDKVLSNFARDFNNAIIRNQLQELLKIPFYLIHLVELFRATKNLPNSKAEIFERLLIARIQLDVAHYRTTIELAEKRTAIIHTLERLALGMEVLGRNYITNDEFQKLINDEELRNLIKYCTVWRKNQTEALTWEFEHNNFQEYLAARVLSRQNIAKIKEFISFEPEYAKVIPSWLNTVSFLLNMSDNHDFLVWILEKEPELAVKFEPDKIDKPTRIQIFKEIFNRYKEKRIWIDTNKFRHNDLAYFGQSDEIVDFLLKELEKPEHYTVVTNAIDLLEHLDIHSQIQRTSQLLIHYALDSTRGEIIQSHALIAITNLKLNSLGVINQILPILCSSNNSRVRSSLYYLLVNSDHLDKYIDVFLEGIRYVRSRHLLDGEETRVANESWNLIKGIEKAKAPDALVKVLHYFKENTRDLDDLCFEKSISIMAKNSADVCSVEPLIFDSALELFTALINQHLENETKQFLTFFDRSNTRLQAFQKLFSQRQTDENTMLVLAALTDPRCVEFLIQQYEEGNLTDEDVWKFQHYLGFKNRDLYLFFNKEINRKSGDKFILPPERDYDKERKRRKQRDIEFLFDKQVFLNEIKVIFKTEEKITFTDKELIDIEIRRWDNPYFSDLAIRKLRDIAGDKPLSVDTAISTVESWDWDWFCISNTYNYLSHDEELTLTEKQERWVGNWCYSHLDKVDFRKALVVKKPGQISASWLAIFLWYFLQKLDLDYPHDVLLDMVSFDWVQGHQMGGIEYLEERLSKIEMTDRILRNLHEGIKSNDVLKNHIDYCMRNRIKEVLPFAVNEIANKNRNDEVRQISLQVYCEMSETLSDLEKVLPKITDDFKWDVVKELVSRNSQFVRTYLKNILMKRNVPSKIKASEYLILLQDLEGLKYYVEWVKRHKQLPDRSSPLPSLRVLESVPLLIKLLKISYLSDFIQDDFNRLDRIVLDSLTPIALESDNNYVEVKAAITKFISTYSDTIKNLNFLNAFMDNLEHKYYTNKSPKMDINDAVKKLEAI